MEDLNDFYIYRLYGWGIEERDRVLNQHAVDIHWHSTPYPHALEVLGQLYQNHKISFITARPMFCKDITIQWLNQHHIGYHDLIFTEDKLAKCQELNVDLLIDDAPHYAEEFVLCNKPYVLYDQPYNRHVEHELILRARSWMEVQQHVERLRLQLNL